MPQKERLISPGISSPKNENRTAVRNLIFTPVTGNIANIDIMLYDVKMNFKGYFCCSKAHQILASHVMRQD